jgi:hypothetical protein
VFSQTIALDPVLESEVQRECGEKTVKIPVGDPEDNELVEFSLLDLKKKVEIAKLSRLLARRWLEVMHAAELARYDANGDLLEPEVTSALAAVENLIAIRRFLANGAIGSRPILLFHHALMNSPEARTQQLVAIK